MSEVGFDAGSMEGEAGAVKGLIYGRWNLVLQGEEPPRRVLHLV